MMTSHENQEYNYRYKFHQMWELWRFFVFHAVWVCLHPDFNTNAFGHCIFFRRRSPPPPLPHLPLMGDREINYPPWRKGGAQYSKLNKRGYCFECNIRGRGELLKVGFYLKAVFPSRNLGLMRISRSRFKQSKNCSFISWIYVSLRSFVNFWVIFGDIWEEMD